MNGLPLDRVAVTGGSGRLGRHVVRELERGCHVTVVDTQPPRGDGTFVQTDVRALDAVRAALRGCGAVVHLAALDDGAVEEEEAYIDVNLRGTWHVLQAAEELGIARVVLASSVAAVGISAANPVRQLPIPVDIELAPRQSYGVTKKICEEFGRTFARRGDMSVICLRPCLVAQPEITWSLARKSAELDGAPPPPPHATGAHWRELRDTPSATRAAVSPGDAARAFRDALGARNVDFGVCYVTGPDTCSSRPTVDVVAAGTGVAPKVTRPEVYAADPCASAYDLEPARRLLGWEPRDRWADHLARVIGPGESGDDRP